MSPSEFHKKLQEAISLGLIENHVDSDGYFRYILTHRGMAQWMQERFLKAQHKAEDL